MATRILEYDGNEVQYAMPVIPHLLVKQTAMTATGSSARSAAFGNNSDLICVQSDEQIYAEPGDAATVAATTDSYRISAGGEAWFAVKPGEKVAIRT